MRIAMVSTPFLPVPPRDYGGTELVVHELAIGLAARGHDVVLFATGDSTAPLPLRYCYARAQWPPEPLVDFHHVTWAMREIADGGFDIVHVHSAAALACARLAPLPPMVYTLHHVRDQACSAFYRWHRDAYYVAISHDQRQREIPLPRVAVIHHGLEPRHYACTDRPGDYLCFVGRFSPIKGIHTAIDVAREAGLPIHVAGSVHAEDAAWADRVLNWRLRQDHVVNLDRVGMEAKVPLLRDAKALLAPIDWNEPFGLVLIEAMLSGCPALAFGRGSVPELVEPGVTGWVARDTEHMVELLRPGGPVDQFDRQRCRARAIERFSSTRMVEDYERLYAGILRRPRSDQRQRLHVA